MAAKYEGLPEPLVPASVDGRLLGEPPWDMFVEMAMDMGSSREEAERLVSASRERFRAKRVRH